MALGHATRQTRQSHLPLPDRPGVARRGEFAGFSFAKAQLLDSLVAPCPREEHCYGQVGSLPHPI